MARHVQVDEVVSLDGGLVVAPDIRAAEAGATIMSAGGNAVDAAVSAAFVIAVLEPYFSGLGGGAWMTLGLRDPDRYLTVSGPMIAPRAAHPDMFPLISDQPTGLYQWPQVAHAANIIGPKSVLVPGAVAALLGAHEKWGRISRHDLLRPAVEYAYQGFEVNWLFAAVIASEARNLLRDKGCATLFMPNGVPLRGPGLDRPDRLLQPALGRTLETIAREGGEVFYRGQVAKALANFIQSSGGILTFEDLRGYSGPSFDEPLQARFGETWVLGPSATGVPTVIEVLMLFEAMRHVAILDSNVAWAYSLRRAFQDRFQFMNANPTAAVPWSTLLSPAYADEVARTYVHGQSPESSRKEFGKAGCTSHISTVDRWGNVVSLTQTVLDVFGARLLEPETGVLLNDGAMYFDPRASSHNAIGPGVPGLSAVCPIVLVKRRGPVAALGGSGGRPIISCTAQLIARLAETEMSLQEAIEAPRLHAESSVVRADTRLPPHVVEELRSSGFDVQLVEEEPTTWYFARPYGLKIDNDGARRSGVDPRKPGGAVVA